MRLIGDAHGLIDGYITIASQVDESVQVGDMGVGFPGENAALRDEKLREFQKTGNHRFIRGNHDAPAICASMDGWIYDGFMDISRRIMYIGGAFSIDYKTRLVGNTMWDDEENSYSRLYKLIEHYETFKPRMVVTHDCPESIATDMFFADGNGWGPQLTTRTGAALEAMFNAHQPELWVFGHWHTDKVYKRPGTETTFICLNELSYIDVNI